MVRPVWQQPRQRTFTGWPLASEENNQNVNCFMIFTHLISILLSLQIQNACYITLLCLTIV